ncbi:MAG: 4-hydroxythreonine-4-phosphate dehydrogenase PdxA [Bacteroidota bacterium]
MNKKNVPHKKKPIIGISIGDVNGIGPEVVMKSFLDNRVLKHVTPVVYCSPKVFSFYRKKLKLDQFSFHQAKDFDSLHFKKVNVISFSNENIEIKCGAVTSEAGKYAFNSLERACSDLKEGRIEGLVTAPINKKNIQSDQFSFPGHTEYLASSFDKSDSLMFMVSESLKVGVVTGHIPLSKVPVALTKELIEKKLGLMIRSLQVDFGISKPKVAVLGLNPHAGEEGLLGDEEVEIIAPAIETYKNKGNLVIGPLPADGFFGSGQFKNYDGVLAMYHDQGLIPFKSLTFEEGVNFTAGIDAIRTSPDHGTAYSIAGKGHASPDSFIKAVFLAKDIIKNKKEQ